MAKYKLLLLCYMNFTLLFRQPIRLRNDLRCVGWGV